jgi:glycosyltransferase involved in cell wall biosynthesis
VQGFTSAAWHRHQTHLLAVSNAVKDDLVRQGISGSRITVLYNAVAPDDVLPSRDVASVRAELGAEGDTPVVGTFAHLTEKKGHRELFDAIPTVVRMLPSAQFWIIGEGKLLGELQATARRYGVQSNVRFLGFRRDVADLMQAIDVMALPSRREPCALVYTEAALARKPIIACRAGGAPESIADGETGLLVPVQNSDAIANALLTLMTNRERAAQMGQAGYERARELFGWERFIATLEAVYDRVLDERGAAKKSVA